MSEEFRPFWEPRENDTDTSVVTKKGINWSRVSPWEPVTRVGGVPTSSDSSLSEEFTFTENWPHFNDKPLPFFAQIVLEEDLIAYVFLDDTVDGSWQAQNGPNAVLVSGSWEVGDWIELKPLPEDYDRAALSYSYAPAFAPDAGLDEPKWLQGDETPEGYSFIFQIPSQIDGGDKINIGQGYGDAYIFLSEDKKTGKVLWQS